MDDLKYYLELIFKDEIEKVIISNPRLKSEAVRKITLEAKKDGWQIAGYTEKQVFHENIQTDMVVSKILELAQGNFKQINAFSKTQEHMLLISKKGSCNYKVNKNANDRIVAVSKKESHNRKKNYILQEGMLIEPLMDMGVFTKEGKVVNAMYDKYKQLNRFLEILNDEISKQKLERIHVIDFGCGKSYLTFVVYYYLTEVMHLGVEMIGLDLKEDVIEKCNRAAQKYGYDHLHFEMGNIDGFQAPFDVDMVITLHACDTATDFALYNAITWNARMIFSVPCCQHELNGQMKPENLGILSRYGIIKERFSALATDAIRGNLLEYCGYRTQLLEFVDFELTPKNIMIRAVKRAMMPKNAAEKYLQEIEAIRKEFDFDPTLYRLLRIGEDEHADD